MKASLVCFLLFCSTFASAEICTVVIRDRVGLEYDSFTRISYSQSAACDDATWDCRQRLSDYQANGRFYDALCLVKIAAPNYPVPPVPPAYPPNYPAPYPPQYPRDPREPNFPRDPRGPGREPQYPRDPGHREPPRNEPGSGPRRPGPGRR